MLLFCIIPIEYFWHHFDAQISIKQKTIDDVDNTKGEGGEVVQE